MIADFDYRPPDVPLAILYEDDQIIVADKPAGLLSVPGKLAGREDCLITRLQAARWDALLVHRLDCDTSGVMIFARNKRAQGFLGQEFEQRRAQKTYIARVAGQMSGDAGRVDLPLCADWPNRPRQIVDAERGKPALTHWRRVDVDSARGRSRIELQPVTGRSHQLRVHLAHIGHPILGDELYAPPAVHAASPRLLLHAARLEFRHPVSGDTVVVESPPPF